MKGLTAQDYRVDFESLPWEQPMQGVRQKAVVQAGKTLRLVEQNGLVVSIAMGAAKYEFRYADGIINAASGPWTRQQERAPIGLPEKCEADGGAG